MSYIWVCGWTNGASDWKDSERCAATSRKKFKTAEAAKLAANRHEKIAGHHGCTGTRDLRKKRITRITLFKRPFNSVQKPPGICYIKH